MRAALDHLRDRAEGRRAVAILGEMAELGADAAGASRGRGARRRSASTSHRASASSRALYGRTRGSPTAAEAASARATCSCGRATSCSSRARASVGLEAVAEALTAVTAHDPRPRSPALVALIVSIVVGPRFIAFLRETSSASTSARRAPSITSSKQGTPTMGGLLILFAATIGFLALEQVHAHGADRPVRDARVRRDRVPRRLHQAHAPALARARRPLEAAAARARSR